MKICLLPFLSHSLLSIADVKILPDNVIINSGKQLYQPEWISKLAYSPVLLVRMEKVGRSISPEFMERYIEKGALGISFVATEVVEGIPHRMAYSFDDSLVRGDEWRGIEEWSDHDLQVMQVAGSKPMDNVMLSPLNFPSTSLMEQSIALISKYYMLKIGDLIAFPLWERYEPILPEQGVFVTDRKEKELLYCGIK